jgi:hypothetical protein
MTEIDHAVADSPRLKSIMPAPPPSPTFDRGRDACG